MSHHKADKSHNCENCWAQSASSIDLTQHTFDRTG